MGTFGREGREGVESLEVVLGGMSGVVSGCVGGDGLPERLDLVKRLGR